MLPPATGPVSRRARTMLVLTTGDPVPSMLEARGPFARMIADAAQGAYDGSFETIDARGPLPEAPPDGAFVVITGSSAHVPEREEWVVKTEAFVRLLVTHRVPTLGICFGHQLLAQALGGEVVRNPRGREIGSVPVELFANDDPILEGLPSTFTANVTHLDTVGTLPEGARAFARSSKDDHQIVKFGERAYGVQFHPELDPFVMRGYLDARRAILEEEGRDTEALKASVEHAPFAVRVLENFVRFALAT